MDDGLIIMLSGLALIAVSTSVTGILTLWRRISLIERDITELKVEHRIFHKEEKKHG